MAVQTWIYGKPEIQYEGCVLNWYERNGYDDSDWYATCWDCERKTIVEVMFDTTRCGGGGHAEIDATPDVLREVYRYWKAIGKSLFDGKTNPEQAKRIYVGDAVRVTGGRKFPKGAVGNVFWRGTCRNPYSGREEERVGIEVDGCRQFVGESQVELVGWEKRLMTGRDRKRRIQNFAVASMPRHYRELFSTDEWRRAIWLGQEPAWRRLTTEVSA